MTSKDPSPADEPKPAAAGGLNVKVVLDVHRDSPAYYANYIEISYSTHEFALTAARVPAKLSDADLADVTATGRIVVEPEVQVLVAPTLLPGLIEALKTQQALYEAQFGAIRAST